MKYATIQLLCGLAILTMATGVLAQNDHGDSWEEATVLTVNAPATDGEIHSDNYFDWFSFFAVIDKSYTITVTPVTIASTRVYLYGPNGTPKITDAENSFVWIATTSDTYYLAVSSSEPSEYGTYNISVTTEEEIDAGLDGGVDGGDWGWTEEETLTGGTGECSCRVVGRASSPLRLLSLLALLFG